jgi:hypothetical protein
MQNSCAEAPRLENEKVQRGNHETCAKARVEKMP